jgi:hypothetical protein
MTGAVVCVTSHVADTSSIIKGIDKKGREKRAGREKGEERAH